MRGNFDNEIRAAITQKGNAKAAKTPMKGSGGKRFGKQKPVANQAAGAAGGKGSMGTRVPSFTEEVAEGEQPMRGGKGFKGRPF